MSHVICFFLPFTLIIRQQTFALELKNEENVMNAPYFTIQCALLYSTSYGERRIRVHTIQVIQLKIWGNMSLSGTAL